jgi:hypothetical protein
VADGEEVVVALARIGEARHAVALPQPVEHRVAAGEQLVRIALVADVEQQPVVPEVEDVVQRDREIDHAEVRRQVPAGLGLHLLADRVRNLPARTSSLIDRQRGGQFTAEVMR